MRIEALSCYLYNLKSNPPFWQNEAKMPNDFNGQSPVTGSSSRGPKAVCERFARPRRSAPTATSIARNVGLNPLKVARLNAAREAADSENGFVS
jgi:hypothetical protein